MRTVNSYLLELAHIVDPTTQAGVEFTSGTICTVRGSRFTAQRLVDIYNEARLLLINALRSNYPKSVWAISLQAMITEKTDLTFTGGIATMPNDCLDVLTLENSVGDTVAVLPYTDHPTVKRLESASNMVVLKWDNKFKSPNGSTYVVDSPPDYVLRYLKYTPWVIADVTGGIETEKIDDDLGSKLIRIATLIANEKGRLEIDQIVKQLIGGKNANQ